jgi:hypothetical protein
VRIRLVALAIATLDALILFGIRQAQTIDTSVWIALIAGIVGILTLIIQTYGQFQIAKLKDRQMHQTSQLSEVHKLVNSGQAKLIEDVKALTIRVTELTTTATERDKADAKIANYEAGKVAADTAVTRTTLAEHDAWERGRLSGSVGESGKADNPPIENKGE